MTAGKQYWRYYCEQQGVSKEVSKRIIAECEKAGSYANIDAKLKQARLSKEVSSNALIPDREYRGRA